MKVVIRRTPAIAEQRNQLLCGDVGVKADPAHMLVQLGVKYGCVYDGCWCSSGRQNTKRSFSKR